MEIENRQLGKVANIVGQMGLDVTYAWDDIVFIEHGVFLFQFTDKPDEIKVFFSTECTEEAKKQELNKILAAAETEQMKVSDEGRFELEQADDEQVQLKFVG